MSCATPAFRRFRRTLQPPREAYSRSLLAKLPVISPGVKRLCLLKRREGGCASAYHDPSVRSTRSPKQSPAKADSLAPLFRARIDKSVHLSGCKSVLLVDLGGRLKPNTDSFGARGNSMNCWSNVTCRGVLDSLPANASKLLEKRIPPPGPVWGRHYSVCTIIEWSTHAQMLMQGEMHNAPAPPNNSRTQQPSLATERYCAPDALVTA